MLLSPTSRLACLGSALVVIVTLGQTCRAVEPLEPRPVELVVSPSVLHVSPEYPGQLVAVLRMSDGSRLDCTRDPETEYVLDAASGCQIDSRGLVELRSAQPIERSAAYTLVVTHAGLRATCPVILEQDATEGPTFAREISAVLGKSGCNAGTCHGNLHGKGGLRLSLRGDDPQLDFFALVRQSGGRRVDSLTPELSLILRKPTGQLAHQGGNRFDADSQSYQWLREWIAAGCRWNAELAEPGTAPQDAGKSASERLVRLEVLPQAVRVSDAGRGQQLVVLAEFADGRIRDVTRWARYETSVVSGVSASEMGLIQAEYPLDVSVGVSYLGGRSATRLTFLPPANGSWQQPPPQTALDAIVERQLKQMRLTPATVADDSVFVRRAYLTVVGRLPTAAEAARFLSSTAEDKHNNLIESLLFDPSYSMLWGLRWSDLLRNEQKVMSSLGAQQWYDWLAQQMAIDRPLNETVHDLIASVGSTYENPPASFHRTHREPETAAETVGQVFLGVRLQCARCHNHPFDAWRQDDYYGLAAYFTTIQRRQLENNPKDKFDKHIISGDEVISLDAKRAEIWHPGLASEVPPKPLTQRNPAAIASGSDAADSAGPLEALADWLTNDNRMFARNMANRIWYHYMGRGIVDPPDDFRDSNPPSNPALLEYLTDELIASNYSARHVARLILHSRTFARSSDLAAAGEPALPSLEDLDATSMFAAYPLRRIPAEIMYDAVRQVTGLLPPAERAIAQADTPTSAGFLTAFGKPNRLLVCECERSGDVTLGQSLLMVNGPELRKELIDDRNRLTKLLATEQATTATIEELYWSALARPPTTDERIALVAFVDGAPVRRQALEDVLWALLNSKEFGLIR